jgi:hypothetical protein
MEKRSIWMAMITMCLLGHVSEAQTLRYDEGAVIEKIIEFDSVPAAIIYKRVHSWINARYKDVSTVENQSLVGQGSDTKLALSKFPPVMAKLLFTVSIDVKDNKARLRLVNMTTQTSTTNFSLEYYLFKKNGDEKKNPQQATIKESALNIAQEIVLSLQRAIQPKGSDSW